MKWPMRFAREIEAEKHDVIILNFANPDMVGHSGKLEPTIRAVEAVDECLGKVVDRQSEKGGVAVIIADHGNADMVVNEDRKSAHCPYHLSGSFYRDEKRSDLAGRRDFGGCISHLAPSVEH